MHNIILPKMKLLKAFGAIAATFLLTACSGRTADNMTPSGETVRVVIPTQDVAGDSAIANGGAGVEMIEQPATPDRK